MNLPRHDELHVISDLHMGGARPDFQILRETRRLAAFIRWVTGQRPDGHVALVLNGDVVDTLAEDIGGYVAVDEALAVFARIMDRDPGFSPVWDALASFVKQPRRTLVIVIGNHDIELAFPAVQHLILTRLAGDDTAARGRVQFSTIGAGYSCLVGGSRVFCTHGNEVDAWNYVRYEDLSRAARRLNTGRALDGSEWEPNAGTRMVKDVMNEVKRRYAWIDLLKPETQAAVGVLVVLDPGQAKKLTSLAPIVSERLRGGSEYEGRLGVERVTPAAPGASGGQRPDQLLGPNLARGLSGAAAGTASDADAMLLAAERNYATRGPRAVTADETLGTGQLVWDRLTGWIRGVSKDEALRLALRDWLTGDATFDIDQRDGTFEEVTKSVSNDVDVIITGHTHLERAIQIDARRSYFNCGTWIRLLRFTEAVLADTASFKPVYDALVDGKMSTIDAAVFNGVPFVMNQTSAVCVKVDPRGVVGSLAHVDGVDPVTVNVVREYVA
jgi:UDP-2,3-diacylglucosamine pyrophosphatase LpxH